MTALVSVVIPAYKAASTIRRAIDSVIVQTQSVALPPPASSVRTPATYAAITQAD